MSRVTPDHNARVMTWKPGEALTFTGKLVLPLAPRADDVDIVDIAHALANTCRFNGHTRRFYSVAEHSVRVARKVGDPRHKLVALLHDAAEAYTGVVIRPLKRYFPELFEAERRVWAAIAEHYALPEKLPNAVTEADNWALHNELFHLLRAAQSDEIAGAMARDNDAPDCWTPAEARDAFLAEFARLDGFRGGVHV